MNFIKVKDISFDILNLSKLPTIDERIVFDLITPKESFKIYNRKKFNLHNLEKSTENGILIRCDDDKNTYGFIETSYIYLGVSKNNVENIINLSESTNFQSELLYDKYYVFMFENEKHLEIEQLANFKFRY
ncbi:hypothetical protein [Maledivibacter halophilus]|uniref:hypothetical protein n=1 Tax=Maledivibacter halophilus TaxID=36842 RepID=UPI0011160E0D|nr:hypothetical protein [Maledivibacter halophilus]